MSDPASQDSMKQSDIKTVLDALYDNQATGHIEHIEMEAFVAFVDSVAEMRTLTEKELQIQAHIDVCESCQQLCQEQLAILGLGAEPTLPSDVSVPNLDMRFLRSSNAAGAREADTASNKRWQDWVLDSLGRLIVEFSEQMMTSLQPPPQLAYAKSGPQANSKELFELRIDAQEDLSLRIKGKQNRHSEDLCDLAVAVDVPSRGGWPMLGGIQVDVRRHSLLLKQVETDPFGEAVVTGIKQSDLPRLVFVVDPKRQVDA